ncbi:DsbC family protein [Niveibacterium sp. SC-1]|uniref:DsbC family protein n=1 Tax=Niveibacterium sp. SC-1 TaxID=3135646 RepID=UPI00311E1BC2
MNLFAKLRPVTLLGALLLPLCLQSARADEADIRRGLKEFLGQETVQSVTKTSYGDLYEVVMDSGEIVYSDAKGSFVISGQLVDLVKKVNVTAQRENDLNRIDFASLPLGSAVKTVRGNGKRVMATFEDPNCGYCKRFMKEVQGIDNVTVYTFLYPILTPDSTVKSKAIWCSKDRNQAWKDWMLEAKAPTANGDCKTPLEANTNLGRKLRINGTPTIFLADGSRVAGMMQADALDKALDEAEKRKSAKK